jgi:hypothetical protein
MRRSLSLFVVLAMLPLGGRADWTIVQKVEGGMNSGQMMLRLKDDKARADIAPQITMITDTKTGDSVTLNHNSKSLIRIPAAEAAKMREMALKLKPGATPEPPKLTPAGRKEKVENYDCEVFTWSIGELQVTDWVSSTYANYQPVSAALAKFQNAGLANSAKPLMPPVEQFPGMVVRREMNHRGTKTTTTILSVKEETLDPKLFEIPNDYKPLPTPALPAPPQ